MTLSVDAGTVFQRIDGFGAAGPFVTTYATNNADFLWGTLGMSIYRSELSTVFTPSIQGFPMTQLGPNSFGPSNFQAEIQAYQRGCREFFVTAWVAATDVLNGPFPWNVGGAQNAAIDPSHYDDFATALTTYLTNGLAAGVPITGISLMNEPDITPSYPQTAWTPTTAIDFVKNHLGPAVATWVAAHPSWQVKTGLSTPRILFGETANWSNQATWIAAVEADATALGFVTIYATHQYFGGGASAPPTPCSRPIWETEVFHQGTTFDATMVDALQEIQLTYDGLTTGNASAWLYWFYQDDNDNDNGGLIGNPAGPPLILTKRSYCLGQLAKFVRPGSHRIAATGAPSGVNAMAFHLPDGRFAIVCINTNASPTALTVSLSGLAGKMVTPWITDATNSLTPQPAISISAASFSMTLTASSVTTFVGGPGASKSLFFGTGTTS